MRSADHWRRWPAGCGALLACIVLAGCALRPPVPGAEPLYPSPSPARVDWPAALAALEPLEHERGGRWPLVLWRGVGFDPLSGARIRAMLARGVVQHLRLGHPDVDAARALADAGAPVVLMEGAGGAWPYDALAGEYPWRLTFPEGATVPPAWRELPDPTRRHGWRRAGEQVRASLEQYRAAGVGIDAVWLDYEGALVNDDYEAVKASRASARLPAAILASERRYRDHRRRYWLRSLSRYLAAPVRQVFPQASVTNWVVMLSATSHPVRGWTDRPHPPSPPLRFTHSNPIAYGIDTYFLHAWPADHPVTRANVDRFYAHLLLRQVSVDARNRARLRPDMGAVVWVARWVPDHPGERVPVMSREAYREALRHIWLRGADAMQVFNPPREGYEAYAVNEVRDAQAVYDEMLAYRAFLDRGEVMSFKVPDNRQPSVLWSGLRLADRAVVRVTRLGGGAETVEICVDAACRELPVPRRGGRTYELDLSSTQSRASSAGP